MRRRGKIDRNQVEIVRALRKIGASVQSLADIGQGCPDLLVGHRGRNFVLEVKDGLAVPSKRKLTPDEMVWHSQWCGNVFIVSSAEEALKLLGN
jgi:hypothetical protein